MIPVPPLADTASDADVFADYCPLKGRPAIQYMFFFLIM